MGLFDDLLAPPPGQRQRLGLFDDLFQRDEGPDEWEEQGIWRVNKRTGERRLKGIPGGLPTAEIDQVIPDLPQPGEEAGVGSFLRLAGSEAISGLPRLAGLADDVTDWMSADPEPDARPGVGEVIRRTIANSPIGLGLQAGKKVRDVTGVTGAVGTANEAIDALQEQERERLRRGADTPLGSVLGEFGALGAGMVADPTNLLGTKTLVRGGRALAGAAPESPIRRFLLQDLFGEKGATLADDAIRSAGGGGRGQAGVPGGTVPGEPGLRGVGGDGFPQGVAPEAGLAGDAPAAAARSFRTGAGDEVPLPQGVAFRGEAVRPGVPWQGKEGGFSHVAGEHWSASRDVAQRYADGYGKLGRVREEALPIERPFSLERRYTYDEARVYGPEIAQRAASISGAKSADEAIDGAAIHKALTDEYLEKVGADRENGDAVVTGLRLAHERILDEGGFDSIHHVHGGADAWSILRRPGSPAAAREAVDPALDSVLSAFPDLRTAEGGLVGLNAFTDAEVAALRKRRLVEKATTSAGETYEGVNPEKLWPLRKQRAEELRAATANAAPGPALVDEAPEIAGRESVAYLPDGTAVPYRWVLRDADSLEASHLDDFTPNPAYPHLAGVQPRDLSDAAEQLKIDGYTKDFRTEMLGNSAVASDAGAGFFARRAEGRPYMVIGNSRTIAARRALSRPEVLARHRAILAEQNKDFGFPEGFLEQAEALGIKKPYAARELVGNFDAAALGRAGNTSAAADVPERLIAAADARLLSDDVLSLFVEGSSIDSAANRDFVRAFLGEVVPQSEIPNYLGPNGELVTGGARRIRSALFAAAYEDPDIVAMLVDSDADGIRAIGRGMTDAAARLTKLARRTAGSEELDYSIGRNVARAAKKTADLRASRTSVQAYLDNGEMFGHELTPEERLLVKFFDDTKRDRNAPGAVLRRYAEIVEPFSDPKQPTMLTPPTRLGALEEAIRTWKRVEGPLLFEDGATGIVSAFSDLLPAPLNALAKTLNPSALLAKARRWLTNYGDQAALGKIAPDVAEKIRLSVSDRAAHEARAAQNLRDYDVALRQFHRELAEAGIQRTEEEIAEHVLAGITGEGDLSGLSPALKDVAQRMREHVDELTGGILENQPLTKELRYTLDQNLGQYLRRTYEIHRDATGWEKVVKEAEPWRWEGAKRWVGEQNPEWTDEQIEGYLNSFFQRQPEAATTIAPRSDVFRVEKGLFKRRIRQNLVHIEGEPTRSYPTLEQAQKAAGELRGIGKKVTVVEQEGLPKELEDFLGLHMDPKARYSESVARMAHDLSTARLMGEIRQMGEGSIFFREPLGGFAAQIPGDPRFNPLAGLWTTPEIRAVFDAMGRPTAGPAWLQKAYAANATVRAGKTVGSPLTHIRNALSWTSMLVANGHFSSVVNIPRFFKAAKVVGGSRLAMQGRTMRVLEGLADGIETAGGQRLSKLFRFDLPALRAEFERAVRLGVIQEGARSQEFARYLGLVSDTKLVRKLAENPLARAGGKVANVARELYVGEDDMGKMIAWLSERANYQWAFPELSDEQVAEITAKLVRDLYPTYSKASPAVKAVRDFPFFGDFPTFWAEIGRTAKNILKQGTSELAQAQTNPRLALVGAKRLAGFGAALAAPVAVAAALRARNGITTEEAEAARMFAPEWNLYSDLLPVEKKGPGQYSMLDASYINPYAMFREAFNALTTNGMTWDDRIEAMFDELRAPFTNEGILTGTAIDLARNRTAEGRTIYSEFGTREEKAAAIAKHVAYRLQPGGVSQVQDAYYGMTGEENPRTGRTVDLQKLVYSFLTGTRQIEIDVPKRLGGRARALQRSRSEISAEFNRIKRRSTGPTTELLEAKAVANAQWKRALADFRRYVQAARTTGLSDYQIREALGAVELGGPTIEAVLGDQDFEVAR